MKIQLYREYSNALFYDFFRLGRNLIVVDFHRENYANPQRMRFTMDEFEKFVEMAPKILQQLRDEINKSDS